MAVQADYKMCEGAGLNLTVTIPFSNEEEARVAYDCLRVDPEPKRGLCTKTLTQDSNLLIAATNLSLLQFLNELTKMFMKARESKSITLTMKRYDGRDRHLPKDGSKNPEPQEYMCLIRATLSKNKISTLVHPKDVNKFQQAYCSLLRGNMDGLKKLKKIKMKSKTT